MKKNKLTAIVMIIFVLVIPLNFGFLEISEHVGAVSLIMMVLAEFLVLGALIVGINKD